MNGNKSFIEIIIIFTITLLFYPSAKAQNIDLLNDDFEFLLKYEKYYGLADSLSHYITSKNIANEKTHLLNSKLALLKNEKSTGMLNIVKSIQMGIYFEHEIMNNKFFKSKLKNEDFKYLDSIHKESIKYKISRLDPDEYKSIIRLFNSDQAYRRFFNQFKDSINITDEKYNTWASKITLQMLKKHISTYGFPKLNLYGEEIKNRLFIVFIHITFSSEFWDDILPILDNAYQGKYINPKFYYYFFDKYLYDIKKNHMISGEYDFYLFQNETVENIINFKTIDNQRNKIGLSPLFYIIKMYGKDGYPGYTFDFDFNIKKIRALLK